MLKQSFLKNSESQYQNFLSHSLKASFVRLDQKYLDSKSHDIKQLRYIFDTKKLRTTKVRSKSVLLFIALLTLFVQLAKIDSKPWSITT
jgi:hypothetical protein